MVRNLAVFLILSFLFSHLLAGTTGKITGVIIDKQNGLPLPRVNIQIGETGMGASSDLDGYYVILNVPVGKHNIFISYIGYKDIIYYNTEVIADGTTRIDFEMEPTILEVSEPIEVIAERDLIKLDNTSSQTVISSELMATQPVDNITQTASMTPGFTEGSYRGGREGRGEIKYLFDGVDLSSPLGYIFSGFNPGQVDRENQNFLWQPGQTMGLATDIPEASVEEVQVITGGMSPQYDAKSAVINVVSKNYSSKYGGFARIRMTPSLYGNGIIIPHDFGQVSGFMTDEEAFAEAKRVGQGSKDVNDWWYASPSQAFVNPQYRRYELGIGGPVVSQSLIGDGRMSFNLNLDIFDSGGLYRGQTKHQETIFGKLVYQTTLAHTLSFSFLASHREQSRWRHGWSRIVSTGDTIYNYNSGDTPDKFLVGSLVHPDGRLEPVENYDMLNNQRRPESWSNLFSFSYKNIISSNTFYELKVSRFRTAQKIRVYDPATGKPLGLEDNAELRISSPQHESFFPENAPPALIVAESHWAVQPMLVQWGRQDDEQTVWSFSGNLRSQINEFNELRLGAEFKQYNLKFDYQSGEAGIGQEISRFDLWPVKIAFYLTDKIETDGMIINAGLRFDYFDPRAILPENFADPVVAAANNPGNPLFWDVNATAEDRIKNPQKARETFLVMPRLGISFPITELDVVHINYGHYFGLPPLGELYNNYTWNLSGGNNMGNPNVGEEKTISYEVGIEHGFNPDIKLTSTLFYKDIADLVNYKKYTDNISGQEYWVKINADFANVYGLELALRTRRWYNLLAQASYTYQVAKGKSSYSSSARYDEDNGRRLRTESFPLDWDVRHTFVSSIDYRVPPNWMESTWLGDWGLSMIVAYNSGRPYTSPQQTPPPGNIKINDARYPSWLNVDLRFFKNFPLWKNIRLGIFLEVYNVFNDRALRQISDTAKYHDGDDDGDGFQNVPTAWAPPRRSRLGFEILF